MTSRENIQWMRRVQAMLEQNPIDLDLTGCGSVYEICERVKHNLCFPDYCGLNWDALWDCMGDVFGEAENEICIRGWNALPESLRADCEPLLTMFGDMTRKNPRVTFTIRN